MKNNMNFWYISLIQLILAILLCVFVKDNYRKIDNELLVLISITSLIPIIGGIIIFIGWVVLFFMIIIKFYND